jgi:hypothetical protein
MADGARHDQRGDDEQSDLQEHEETGVLAGERHRALLGSDCSDD